MNSPSEPDRSYPTKDAREIIERAMEPFALSNTLRKKLAAAVLDEFKAGYGEATTGEPVLMLLRMP